MNSEVAENDRPIGLKINSFKDLLVWQTAMELAVNCYECTRRFPAQEMYGMTSQIRRSSSSIAANIAEGFGRDSTGAFVQFLRVAQGSLKELETHLILSSRVGLLDDRQAGELGITINDLGKMLRALIRSLQKR